jgi:hypothetical protein
MNKIEKRAYVFLFIVLAIIAGVSGNKQAEQDHQLRRVDPSSNENAYIGLIKNIKAHQEFSNK